MNHLVLSKHVKQSREHTLSKIETEKLNGEPSRDNMSGSDSNANR